MNSNYTGQLEPYIIADLCLNHEGDINICKEMTLKAKKAGCNAVKIQSLNYNDGSIIKILEETVKTKKYGKISYGALLKKLLLSDEETQEFANYCKEVKIDFISTIYGFQHADILNNIGVDKFKIASQDLIHLRLIEEVAKKQKPMVVSVGMGTISEIEAAIETIRKFNQEDLIILYCISLYPPKDSELNLNRILTLKNTFDIKIGFSDHTLGITAAIIATTLGAEVIERHFTYDKKAEGWDHALSSDYDEMKLICSETRRVREMLGHTFWNIPEAEILQKEKMRRSIVTKTNLKEGDIITEDHIDFKRPGSGIRPDEVKYVLGRKTNKNIPEDELIHWDDLV